MNTAVQPIQLDAFVHRACKVLLPTINPPPEDKAVMFFEALAKTGPILARIAPNSPEVGAIQAISAALDALRAPVHTPTADQMDSDKVATQAYLMVNATNKQGIDVHQGIGAAFFDFTTGELRWEVYVIPGEGAEARHEYLNKVMATADIQQYVPPGLPSLGIKPKVIN